MVVLCNRRSKDEQLSCTLPEYHTGIHRHIVKSLSGEMLVKAWKEEDSMSVYEPKAKTEEKLFGGIKSTKLARLELIPKSALESLADRFELGIERKGNGAWNALTMHLSEMTEQQFHDFTVERLAHVIHHCYDAIQKITAGNLAGEDDAGAILFGGAVLAEFKERMKK